MATIVPEALRLEPNGGFPNSTLPVLVYRATGLTDAGEAERTLGANRWSGGWRDGIFDFHHFHSTAHEVLVVVSGEVTVTLGGPGGRTVEAGTGDVLVLPAGTGHCRDSVPRGLLVVGAYPDGMQWDMRRGDPAERDVVGANVAAVPLPRTDPLAGAGGPLVEMWGG